MNILQLYCSQTAGGGEFATLRLSKALSELGHKVFVAAPQHSFLYNKAKEEKIKCNSYKYSKFRRYIRWFPAI